jgi:hypothetical protein
MKFRQMGVGVCLNLTPCPKSGLFFFLAQRTYFNHCAVMIPSDVKAKLVAMFPEFVPYWDSSGNHFRDDDGSYTLCGVFAQFSHFVRERFSSLSPSELGELGRFIEQCMERPGSDLANAAATCLLENVAGEKFTSSLVAHFGSRARKLLS